MEFILLVLAVGLLFLLYSKYQQDKRKSTPNFTPFSADELRIENVEAGGLIKLHNIGENAQDFDVKIIAKHLYKEPGFEWFELEGDNGLDKVWITVEDDDELEIFVVLRKFPLEELKVSVKDLHKMIKKDDGSIRYKGKTYNYEDDGKATFYRYGDPSKGKAFQYWEFKPSSNSKHIVAVELWSDGSVEAYYCQKVRSSDVEVYANKAAK